jgi:hypothetical protein
MSVTLLVSQDDTSLLKDKALWNVYAMVVTLLVSQDDTSLLNDDAPSNIAYMVVALLVIHADKSSSKVLGVEQAAVLGQEPNV